MRFPDQKPASAPLTPATAHGAPCAPLRARIRYALDFGRVANSRFVADQITQHLESQVKQQYQVAISTRLQETLRALDTIAADHNWSQRKLAARAGMAESTLRKLKSGRVSASDWLPRLTSVIEKLQAN